MRNKRQPQTIIKRQAHEPVVKPNLACTPTQIATMAQKGIAISNNSVDLNYYDGETDITFNEPIDQNPHADIAEIWEAQQNAREKVNRVSKKFKVKTNRYE